MCHSLVVSLFLSFQVEGLRDQLLRAKRVAGEIVDDQKRLQRELASAAGAVEDRTRLQQRFAFLLRARERELERERGCAKKNCWSREPVDERGAARNIRWGEKPSVGEAVGESRWLESRSDNLLGKSAALGEPVEAAV